MSFLLLVLAQIKAAFIFIPLMFCILNILKLNDLYPITFKYRKALIQRCHLRVIFVSRQLYYNHHCKIKCFMLN